MDILNATLIADLTAAVYSVIGKNKLDYTKENATKVIRSLANICSSLCAISQLDFDTFLQEAKESHDDFRKSGLLDTYQKKYQVKESSMILTNESQVKSPLDLSLENSSDSEAIKFSTNIFNLVFDKCVDIMEEKTLLVSDMPLLIGCLGAVGTYFCKTYNVSKDILISTIENYNTAMDSYDPEQDLSANVDKLKSKLNVKEPNPFTTTTNVSTKKKFDLN